MGTEEENEMEMFDCPQCGTPVPKESEYCVDCEEKVSPEEESSSDVSELRDRLERIAS